MTPILGIFKNIGDVVQGGITPLWHDQAEPAQQATQLIKGGGAFLDPGLRLLEEQDARLAALRKAIRAGVDSGPTEPFDFDAYTSAWKGELKRG